MRLVNLLVELIEENCTGCSICEKVCPTLAIRMVPSRKPGGPKQIAAVEVSRCLGCWACEQRCPFYALRMVRHPAPYTVGVSAGDVDPALVQALCAKAHLHPEQVVCFCTTTRAEEVAAAILKGLETPEELSYYTGVRTGCKVECIQPVLRLLEAAGLPATPALKHGWQVYGRTVTAWEVSEQVKARFSSRGFYFDEDLKLLSELTAAREKEASDATTT